MDNNDNERIYFDFHVGRTAYEHLLDLAKRGGYENLELFFHHSILLMDLIISSHEEGYEFYRVGEDSQERLVFAVEEEIEEDPEEELEDDSDNNSVGGEVIQLFPKNSE